MIKEGKEPARVLLIDWELGKKVDEGGSRQLERTVSHSVRPGARMLNLIGDVANYVW